MRPVMTVMLKKLQILGNLEMMSLMRKWLPLQLRVMTEMMQTGCSVVSERRKRRPVSKSCFGLSHSTDLC
jgi:hypothetical protein